MSLKRDHLTDDPLFFLGEAGDRAESSALAAGRRYTRLATRRGFVLAAALGLAAVATGAAPLRFEDRFYPHTSAGGIDLSGLTRDDAIARIRDHAAALEASQLPLRFGEQTWTPSLATLGYHIDTGTMIDRAWQHGRDQGIPGRYEQALGLQGGTLAVPIVWDADTSVTAAYLDGVARQLDFAAKDAQLAIVGGEIVLTKGSAGMQLNVAAAQAAIAQAVAANRRDEIALEADYRDPSVTTAMLEPAYELAKTLVSGPVRLRGAADATASIAASDLFNALRIPPEPAIDSPYLSADVLAPLVEPYAGDVARRPENALLWGDDSGVHVWEEGTPGQALDPKATAAAVAEAAKQQSASSRVADLAVSAVPPDVREDALAALGLVTVLARGKSSIAGSGDARRENVGVAAQHVSRSLLAPNATWSFNQALGPITTDNGYVEGHSILGNWYADDIGGGVCQISTTVFRAALFGGFRFDEWHYHAYRLAFYELDGMPPGLDAAIYQPNNPNDQELDLKIANPTSSWAYLQVMVDGDHVTAELYGSPVGYDVTVDPPRVGKAVKPKAPVVRTDPSLKKGQRVKYAEAISGCDVITTRRFVRDGETIDSQTFASYYQPQPEMWLVGPK